MIYLTDTCFWSHVNQLFEDNVHDFRTLLELYNWGLTEEVMKELRYHRLDQFIDLKQAYIIPISQKEQSIFLAKYPFLAELDKADQTLIIAGKKEESVVLTDDGSLFMNCTIMNVKCFLLPHFCLNQCRFGYLSKNIVSKCLRYWEDNHLYPKREIKKWYQELQSIH